MAVMAFGMTDTLVASHYSEQALAALSVGAAVFISVYVSLMGVFQALLPLWAEQHGANQPQAIGRSLRQAMYLCAAACVLGMGLLLSPDMALQWTRVPPELQAEVKHYLAILAWGLPAALLFRIYSTLNQALGRPKLVTWLQLFSLLIKIPLSIWLSFGGAGMPTLGLAGCAWATVCVNYAMLGIALVLMRSHALYAPLDLWRPMERPDFRLLADFARQGIPAGLAILVEITSFTLMALFVARQGTLASASHQIAANLTAFCYMVPLSLAIATSARIGFWRGAGDEAMARRLAAMGYRLALLMALSLAAIVFLGRFQIAGFYSQSPQLVELGAALLAWVALYHVADAVQTFCLFVLRCWRITVAPLLVYCLLLWGGGLGGGYWLAYEAGDLPGWVARTTPAPFWISSAMALLLTAAVMSALVRRVTRPEPQA
nr:MATE family efflux transporter [Comamonas composti]